MKQGVGVAEDVALCEGFLAVMAVEFGEGPSLAQEFHETLSHAVFIGRLTLPNNERIPAGCAKRLNVPAIAKLIAFQLRPPVAGIRLWRVGDLAAMGVPKATMDENDFPPRGEDKIRLPWKIFPVQTKAVAKAMHNAPHLQLGSHILAADSAHVGAAVH
jgi:hypothetical protein